MIENHAQNPTLSVVVICYNHAAFIQDTLEGILNQVHGFSMEILVFDDASTDATVEVVNQIQKEHPKGDKIILKAHQKNKGMLANFTEAIEQASGRFIALCEGDDYWMAQDKIQTQIGFLEMNKDHSAVASHIIHVDVSKTLLTDEWPNINEQTSIDFRMIGCEYPVPTCTLVFRNGLSLNTLKRIKKVSGVLGDYPLITDLLLQGKIAVLPQKMAAYRHHTDSNFSSSNLSDMVSRGLLTRKKITLGLLVRFKWISAAICVKNTIRFKRKYRQ